MPHNYLPDTPGPFCSGKIFTWPELSASWLNSLWFLCEHKGWRLKVYGITYQGEYPRTHLVESAKALASERLPSLVDTPECYGVGFSAFMMGAEPIFSF